MVQHLCRLSIQHNFLVTIIIYLFQVESGSACALHSKKPKTYESQYSKKLPSSQGRTEPDMRGNLMRNIGMKGIAALVVMLISASQG